MFLMITLLPNGMLLLYISMVLKSNSIPLSIRSWWQSQDIKKL